MFFFPAEDGICWERFAVTCNRRRCRCKPESKGACCWRPATAAGIRLVKGAVRAGCQFVISAVVVHTAGIPFSRDQSSGFGLVGHASQIMIPARHPAGASGARPLLVSRIKRDVESDLH